MNDNREREFIANRLFSLTHLLTTYTKLFAFWEDFTRQNRMEARRPSSARLLTNDDSSWHDRWCCLLLQYLCTGGDRGVRSSLSSILCRRCLVGKGQHTRG
jgi:hypothetical protein